MRKFGVVYKEKQNKAMELHENHIAMDFKNIYNALLEHYNLTAINDLNEKSQISFLTELNQYWNEEAGLNEKGSAFLQKKSMRLNENSTPLQKKNFLKTKSNNLLNELMRKSDLKYRVYGVLDEMFSQTESNSIDEVLSPSMISEIVTEAFATSLDSFIQTIHHELHESTQPKQSNKKVYLNKRI